METNRAFRLLAFLMFTLATNANAYVFFKTGTCSPGSKWDTTDPVNVYFLGDSLADMLRNYANEDSRTSPPIIDGEPYPSNEAIELIKGIAENDIISVVREYNSVDGSGLILNYGGIISGDDNLDDYGVDDFADHSIVVGFTDLSASSNPDAPAWSPGNPNDDPEDDCLYSSRHIYFKKTSLWTFGAPATADVNGKYFPEPDHISFRAVLLHEMGHALGLAHETDEYAVMDHGTKAWTRGRFEEMQMELLPDDIQGIHTLYNDGSVLDDLDISVTNTWFLSAEERTSFNEEHDIRHDGCEEIEILLADLEVDRTQQLAIIPFLQGPHLAAAQAQLAVIEDQIAVEEENLSECYYAEDEAAQFQNCKISSRAEFYADKGDGLVFCGVNAEESDFAPVSKNVCPGDEVQLRVTINNKSLVRDAGIRLQMWVSQDDDLQIKGANQDYKSEVERDTTVNAATSITNGRVFTIPSDVPASDEDYRIYVRAVPVDIATGISLWEEDSDFWNNSIRVRESINISPLTCP